MANKLNEQWRPVAAFPGYSVSSFGRVRSEERTVLKGRVPHRQREKILKASPHKGYPRVSLRRDGKTYYVFCHQIVMLEFVGPCPFGQEVRHQDGQSGNPRLDNLEYGTRAQNVEDAKRHGTFPLYENRPGAILTKAAAIQIAKSSDTADVLASRHGVEVGTIQQIRNGTTWRDIVKDVRKLSYRPVGERHSQAKLTATKVRHIRSSSASHRALARQYGVDRVTIRNIILRKTWKHVV